MAGQGPMDRRPPSMLLEQGSAHIIKSVCREESVCIIQLITVMLYKIQNQKQTSIL